ncbi:MAG: hypothetical protein NC901_03215 [Candidatus Omnitrophica bacterium]|nr:hypothetical protein [Candidatus Omnitrophota bacterium]
MESKKTFDIDNLDEQLKEKTQAFINFIENFDRSRESITIKDPKKIFGVKTSDPDGDIIVKLKFFTYEEKNEITKLMNENKTNEAEVKVLVYGIKEWNLVDENGQPLPINAKVVTKLNDVLFKVLNLVIKAKNREPDINEMTNFLIF